MSSACPVHISSWWWRPPMLFLFFCFGGGENAVEALTKSKKLWKFFFFFSTNKSRFLNQRGWRGLRQNMLDFESLHHLGFWMVQWLQPCLLFFFSSSSFCVVLIISCCCWTLIRKKATPDFKSKQTDLRRFCFRGTLTFVHPPLFPTSNQVALSTKKKKKEKKSQGYF